MFPLLRHSLRRIVRNHALAAAACPAIAAATIANTAHQGIDSRLSAPAVDRVQGLAVFARAFGYIRYFHPSDEGAAADWDALAIGGALTLESSTTAAALRDRLEAFFAPFAPTVRFVLGSVSRRPMLVPAGANQNVQVALWLLAGPRLSVVRLLVRTPAGQEQVSVVSRSVQAAALPSPLRAEKMAELTPGTWYLDLSRLTDEDVPLVLARLSSAQGLILDLRDYPAQAALVLLLHLSDKPLRGLRFQVPVVTLPDRRGWAWDSPLSPFRRSNLTSA